MSPNDRKQLNISPETHLPSKSIYFSQFTKLKKTIYSSKIETRSAYIKQIKNSYTLIMKMSLILASKKFELHNDLSVSQFLFLNLLNVNVCQSVIRQKTELYFVGATACISLEQLYFVGAVYCISLERLYFVGATDCISLEQLHFVGAKFWVLQRYAVHSLNTEY